MNQRLKLLRKQFNLNQSEFALRIGVSQSAVAAWESGIRNPIDAIVQSICREFGVSEAWLRTGEGDMFPPRDEMDELMAMAGRFLSKELTDFQQRWARMLFSLTPEEWALLERKALELTGQDKEKTEEP